jgi:hypothetical protein
VENILILGIVTGAPKLVVCKKEKKIINKLILLILTLGGMKCGGWVTMVEGRRSSV